MSTSFELDKLITQALSSSVFDFENNQPPKPVLPPADAKINSVGSSTFRKLQEEERNSKLKLKISRKKRFKNLAIGKKGFSRFDKSKNITKTKSKSRPRLIAQNDAENLDPVVSLSKLSKRQLDGLGTTTSPLKNLKKVSYSEHPLARRAAEYKKKENATAGRNVSIVLFRSPTGKTPRHTIAITQGPPGGPHAELKAFDLLPLAVRQNASELVFAVYTERAPCTNHDSGCARKLKSVLDRNAQILYTTNHDSNPRRQLFTELEFQRTQAEEGIRLSACYAKNVAAAEELAKEQNLDFDSAYYRNVPPII